MTGKEAFEMYVQNIGGRPYDGWRSWADVLPPCRVLWAAWADGEIEAYFDHTDEDAFTLMYPELLPCRSSTSR
jgi:hypothetical protein